MSVGYTITAPAASFLATSRTVLSFVLSSYSFIIIAFCLVVLGAKVRQSYESFLLLQLVVFCWLFVGACGYFFGECLVVLFLRFWYCMLFVFDGFGVVVL